MCSRIGLGSARSGIAHNLEQALEVRAFGDTLPLGQRAEQNRRVEFLILRKTSDGAAGWREGTVSPNVQRTETGSKPP